MEKEFRLKDLFSQEEIQLLYHACLSYGENLAEANKKYMAVQASQNSLTPTQRQPIVWLSGWQMV